MDDLKLDANRAEDLQEQLCVTSEVTQTIGLEINIQKRAQAHYDPHKRDRETTDVDGAIPLLAFPSTY